MDAHGEPDQRVGRPPDAAALVDVTAECFAGYREWAPEGWNPPRGGEADLLEDRLAQPGYWCWMAEAGGEAVGYVVLRPALTTGDDPQPIPGLAHIWHLFVRPARHRRGGTAGVRGGAALDAAGPAPNATRRTSTWRCWSTRRPLVR
jgi:hypothetical protein